ncbi:MAG: diaminopimelate epimerase [Parachlamydiales bacterium]|nr:diaminopimelate epimerase [Parachlamydiales bacterium]
MILYEKYHHLGNDFILIDNRDLSFKVDPSIIAKLCHRQTGIGGDGLILLQQGEKDPLRMRIFNADGKEATSCGNGLLCFCSFAETLGYRQDLVIETLAGSVRGTKDGDKIVIEIPDPHIVSLEKIIEIDHQVISCMWLHTGVDHAVVFYDPGSDDWEALGRKIRHHPFFAPTGVNVDFVKMAQDQIEVRTYEKGVEAMTYACGTGAIAVAIAVAIRHHWQSPIMISFALGTADVCFKRDGDHFYSVQYQGSPTRVFTAHL